MEDLGSEEQGVGKLVVGLGNAIQQGERLLVVFLLGIDDCQQIAGLAALALVKNRLQVIDCLVLFAKAQVKPATASQTSVINQPYGTSR